MIQEHHVITISYDKDLVYNHTLIRCMELSLCLDRVYLKINLFLSANLPDLNILERGQYLVNTSEIRVLTILILAPVPT